jgi:hypothetical protein
MALPEAGHLLAQQDLGHFGEIEKMNTLTNTGRLTNLVDGTGVYTVWKG